PQGAPGDNHLIPLARTEAIRADYAVVVVGDTVNLTGEHKSTATLELQGGQVALLDAVAATKTPMIVVLVNSKPSVLPPSALHAPPFTGAGARLPRSGARHVGQQPVYYNPIRGQHGSRYADLTQDPLF